MSSLTLTEPPTCACGSHNVDPYIDLNGDRFLVSYTNAHLFVCNSCGNEWTPDEIPSEGT